MVCSTFWKKSNISLLKISKDIIKSIFIKSQKEAFIRELQHIIATCFMDYLNFSLNINTSM